MILDDKQRLYALRCVDKLDGSTTDTLGIAESALLLLVDEGLLNVGSRRILFRLTKAGVKWMEKHGGPFHYG
jgi:hypothetical protein